MNRTLNLLGICKKSGNLTVGSQLIESIQTKKAQLVIISTDVAINNEKKITNKCIFYNIELIKMFRSDELSGAIGKKNVIAVSINEAKLAKKIKESLGV